MATAKEIERRVEQTDTSRTAKRSAAATRVFELAQRRAVLVEQLADLEHELGDVLIDAQDVIDVDELARFTDLPAADLTGWLTARTARKTTRGKRKRPVAGTSASDGDLSEPSALRAPSTRQASAVSAAVRPRADASDAPAGASADVA
jgi:hypothetical protein